MYSRVLKCVGHNQHYKAVKDVKSQSLSQKKGTSHDWMVPNFFQQALPNQTTATAYR